MNRSVQLSPVAPAYGRACSNSSPSIVCAFHCYECRRIKILFLLQDSVVSMSVHSCHMHVTDPHCSVIGDGDMALKWSEVLGWPVLKQFRSAVGLQMKDGFKAGQTSLNGPTDLNGPGFKLVHTYTLARKEELDHIM